MNERRTLLTEDLNLEIPEFTFRPNVWTEVFLTGLQSVVIKDKRVMEIGVGTGIVAIELLRRGVKEYVGLDIDERILPLARRNIAKKVPQGIDKIQLIHSDLFESFPDGSSFDIICGCLPQVRKPSIIELGTADSYARYFDAEKYQSELNAYGLGLNERVLLQAKTRLKEDGSMVLVLSGRAGRAILEQFFLRNGYRPQLLFEDSILQLRETTLATLVKAEEEGHEFYFYQDALCQEPISVKEAEERRLEGLDSYHKIYVFEGKLLN